MNSALLRCCGLSCGHRGRAVLQGVDLDVTPGEIVALLGPNGSGKTTLLRTISNELTPLAGEIWVGGDSLSGLRAAEIARRVSVVPQEENPVFAFSVREAVTLGRLARSFGLFDTDEDRLAATDAMRLADCLELADRPITELSGGERQRVLIARAVAQDTPLVLLDEPTSHLDPLHQIQVAALARELAAGGKAILAAVHDLNLAMELADRAVLLGSGGVLMTGGMQEVLRSSSLDEAYQVSFDRIESRAGILVRPRLP